MENQVKLNLGGGKLKFPGFINVDLTDGADLKHDLRTPLPFKDGEVSEIVAVHVIESFYKWQFVEIIKDWKRVLKGKMTIEFTDLDTTVRMYLSDNPKEKLYGKWGIHSGQDVKQDPLGYHHYVYTVDELKKILEDAGFTDISFTHEGVIHHKRRDYRVICYSE